MLFPSGGICFSPWTLNPSDVTMARAQKRLKRKEIKQDPLVKTVADAELFFHQHGRKFMIAGGVLLVAVIVALFIGSMRESRNEESMSLLSETRGLINEGKTEQAKTALRGISNDYSGTTGGAEALFTLAQINLEEGNSEKAAEQYERFLEKYKGEYLLDLSAMDGYAVALENLERFEEAAAMYDRIIAKDKMGHLKPFALYKAGRCYREIGDFETAQARFQTVIDDYPDLRNLRHDAEYALAELNFAME
ncbi:tetratricopeptide repeat protein [bacterium]|nr:tetratricopeptide repeat protein [bacterium]